MTHSVAPEIGHCIARNHGLQVRSIRNRHSVLRCAVVGTAHRSDMSVEPWLRADPLRDVESIIRVIPDRKPMTFRLVSTTHVLRDHDVATWHKVIRSSQNAVLVIWCSLQDYREPPVNGRAVSRRAIDVSREFNAVPHWDHFVFGD